MRFEIPEPCDEDWGAMRPTREGRFCERCQHGVVDLARLTRSDAERRLASEPGDYVCVRLAIDPEDRPIFRAEPKRAPHWAGGLVLVAALTAGGCTRSETEGAESAQLEPEPCSIDDGPPMMPVDTGVAPPVDAAAEMSTGPLPSEVEDDDAEPTAEQQELTRRKQARTRPPIRHLAGRMPIRRTPFL